MSGTTLTRIVKHKLSEYYTTIFINSWPVSVGGVCMSILALFIFLWKGPWGIAGGFHNIGSWFYHLTGMIANQPSLPWVHPIVLSTFGLFIGALASAMMSREFRIQRTSGIEYTKGLVGGAFMGAGAALSGGCNVGGFFSAIAMFSLGGFFMWCGLIGGAIAGLRILMWEINRFPQRQSNSSATMRECKGSRWGLRFMPYVGALLIILSVLLLYVAAEFEKTTDAGLCFMGLLMGIILHRSRFCFAGAFRDPFMTGDYRMIKAVIISIIIYCFGSAVIKWNYIQPYTMGVHHVWLGSLLGGFLFGIGMLLAGGCASSTVWRMAEGQTKYLMTAVSFCLVHPMTVLLIQKHQLLDLFGKGIFLPDAVGWGGTLPIILLFLLIWGLVAVWNEKTEKLVLT